MTGAQASASLHLRPAEQRAEQRRDDIAVTGVIGPRPVIRHIVRGVVHQFHAQAARPMIVQPTSHAQPSSLSTGAATAIRPTMRSPLASTKTTGSSAIHGAMPNGTRFRKRDTLHGSPTMQG